MWKLSAGNLAEEPLIALEVPDTEISNNQSTLTENNLEIAQFINLLIDSGKLRDCMDTLGNKAVVILSRFTPGRKAIRITPLIVGARSYLKLRCAR
jgi:hypothetical protein